MLDGSGSAFSQLAIALLAAMALGVALGRFAWPRRPSRRDTRTAPVIPATSAPTVTAPGETRSEQDRAERDRAEQDRAEQAKAWAAELQERLGESQAALKETQARLGQAEAELLRLRRQVRGLEDRKEAEMGRLESGAIAALESAIAAHAEQVARLEEKLLTTEGTVEEHIRELAIERNRCAQLRSALADRDQHIATLASDRA